MILLLSGCGSAAINITDEQPGQEAEIPVTGGTLNMAMRKPETLNPLLNRDDSVDKVLRLVFEPLFVIDSEMQVSPNLAEKYTLSNNGASVTIKLRAGMLWQDGAPITSDDVIYSLDVLKNAAGDSIYKSCRNNISGYSKLDETSLRIDYSRPVGAVGYSLCFPIIPAQHYKKGNVDMYPVGSGFYRFKSYTMVKEMDLTASDNCFKGRPYITNVSVKIMPDKATEIQALSSGIIDCACVDMNELGSLDSSLSKNAVHYNTNHFEYIGLNTRNKLFSNVSVRQAIAGLIPFEDIVSQIYINKMTQSITPVNPNSPYYSDVGVSAYDIDSNMINALISAGGLTKNDFTFTILVNNENPERVEAARAISRSFNENGFASRVEAIAFDQYSKRLASGSYDMYLGGIRLSENMDLSAFLGSKGPANYTGYASADTDKLIAACNTAADDEAYKRSLNELNKAISRELPVIGIGFESEALVTSGRVRGHKQPTLNNLYGNADKWFLK